tara:strand:+ start:530 stop:655 length:126 start_codon:yes stop_codon:yes gene_type:complete
MEKVTDITGSQKALLVEKIFWIGIGVFIGLAIISSLIRGFN